MKRLVAYDVSSPGRLYRVSRICSYYGVRVEKSVFECDMADAKFEEMWQRLMWAIDEEEDAVICYPVCESCMKKVRFAGVASRPKEDKYLIF